MLSSKNNFGKLILLPTSLTDCAWERYLSPFAHSVSCTLRYYIVENAKQARAELKRINHPLPLTQIHIEQISKHNENISHEECSRLLKPISLGNDVGLMSDAGCPAIADPGAQIVRAAHNHNITVQPLVGASSILLGLMASGLEGQRFTFHGYIPVRDPQRTQFIIEIEKNSKRWHQTQIFIETPFRNEALFLSLLKTCSSQTHLSLAINLTSDKEYIRTQRIAQWREKQPLELSSALKDEPALYLLLAE